MFRNNFNIKNCIKLFLLIIIIFYDSASQADTLSNDSLEIIVKQKKYNWHSGVSAGALLNLHSVDFQSLPGVPSCCPQYSSGYGFGYSFGFLIDWSLFETNDSYLELRVDYLNNGGLIKATEREIMYYDPNTSVDGLIEHSIDASLHYIDLEPMFKYNFWNEMNLHVGLNFGWMLSNYFKQKEFLLEPEDYLFENQSRTRMTFEGEIPGTNNFQAGISAGLSYNFPLNKSNEWIASPELFFNYGISDVLQNDKWKISSIRLGLTIAYSGEYIKEYEEIKYKPYIKPKEIVKPDTVIVEKIDVEKLKPKVKKFSFNFLDSSGNIIKEPVFNVKNSISARHYPFVNYVFFDSASAELQKDYIILSPEETKKFEIDSLEGLDAVPLNFQIINILGKKLHQNRNIKLTLIGCNSNNGKESRNLQLSKARAETVKDYLIDIWKIDKKRITVKARNLPATPSNPESQIGMEENRRVELVPSDMTIFYPVFFEDTSRYLLSSRIRFNLDIENDSNIASWQFRIKQNSEIIRVVEGTRGLKERIELVTDNFFAEKLKSEQPLEFSLSITDVNGETTEHILSKTEVTQNYEQKSEFEIYSLLLFNFDKHQITDSHIPVLNFIKTRVKPNSKVRIVGYADDTGDFEHNMILSERRAQEVEKYLNVKAESVKGVGNVITLYQNNIPLGRFLSRTVEVIIETPK